jgi:hypothetical protein
VIIREPDKLKSLERTLPWYAETRPHQVKRLGFVPVGLWAVGPAEQRRVRWLFQHEADMREFKRLHRGFLLVAGYLGPVVTDHKIWH